MATIMISAKLSRNTIALTLYDGDRKPQGKVLFLEESWHDTPCRCVKAGSGTTWLTRLRQNKTVIIAGKLFMGAVGLAGMIFSGVQVFQQPGSDGISSSRGRTTAGARGARFAEEEEVDELDGVLKSTAALCSKRRQGQPLGLVKNPVTVNLND